jgi:hypothetical protein
MTGQELTKLWELYPEVRELYEHYNGIMIKDDVAWKELADIAGELIQSSTTELKTTVILETVQQIEKIARKRKGINL